jgi:tRNA A37 threonylcarbamoyladenosine synthetase subunit TsaC/SUA5/YrdC
MTGAWITGEGVVVVVDGGTCDGEPSTVVDCTGAVPLLVRKGAVEWSEIMKVGP